MALVRGVNGETCTQRYNSMNLCSVDQARVDHAREENNGSSEQDGSNTLIINPYVASVLGTGTIQVRLLGPRTVVLGLSCAVERPASSTYPLSRGALLRYPLQLRSQCHSVIYFEVDMRL